MNDQTHCWRASPFFKQQFEVITHQSDRDAEQPFLAEILGSRDDDPLLVFADWLAERGDARCDYIREMCDLANGKRPIDPLVERACQYQEQVLGKRPILYGMLGEFTLVVATAAGLYGPHRESFSNALRQTVDSAGNLRLIVDLRRVEFIDGRFCSDLILAWRTTRENGGELRACVSSGSVSDVFRILKLNRIWRVCSTIDEAVSFTTQATVPAST